MRDWGAAAGATCSGRARPTRSGRAGCCPWPSVGPCPRPNSCSHGPRRRLMAGEAAAAAATKLDLVALSGDIARRVGSRRSGTLRSRSSRRWGGWSADLLATATTPSELRALVRFARSRDCRSPSWSRAATPRHLGSWRAAAWWSTSEPRAAASTGQGYVVEAGVPMAAPPPRTQRAGLTGLEFGRPGPARRAARRCGECGAHRSDVHSVLESATSSSRMARKLESRRRARARLPRQPLQARSGGRIGRGRPRRPLPAPGRLGRRDQGPGSTTSGTWRQGHQPLGLPPAGSSFRNAGAETSAGEHPTDRPPRVIRRRTVSEKLRTHRQRPQGHGGRRPATDGRVRSPVLGNRRAGAPARDVFPRRLAGWPWPTAETSRDHAMAAGRRPARRADRGA